MRFFSRRSVPERRIEELSVDVNGDVVPVAVKRNGRARRLILRFDAATGRPVVTLPKRTPLAEGERFLRNHADWLTARLDRRPVATPFRNGAVFPLRGEPCRILHRSGRGLVRVESDAAGPVLIVHGEAGHARRRVTDWLKREARRDLQIAVSRHAAALGRSPSGIRIGDAKSRWGSCSSFGVLSFSWRLVLAPPEVLGYLAAHEVAHLAEMNHGPRFWAAVRMLDPSYESARAWLKRHGAGLHAIGREP